MSIDVDLEDFGEVDDLITPVERADGGIWL